jgi:hypothetical protein
MSWSDWEYKGVQVLGPFKATQSTMRTSLKAFKSGPKNTFTFGDLVVAIYGASNKRKARALLRFAVNAHLVEFPESHQSIVIS